MTQVKITNENAKLANAKFVTPDAVAGKTLYFAQECKTAYGPALIVFSVVDEIMFLGFCTAPAAQAELATLQRRWQPQAMIEAGPCGQVLCDAAFGRTPPLLLLAGTLFQHRVWQALLETALGTTCSYGGLAKKLGSHARPVGSAGVARNPVSLLVPCHRVLNGQGKLHDYRWGVDLKRRILADEAAAA